MANAVKVRWLVAAMLIALFWSLRPLMVDGDGLAHASNAIYKGFLSGMQPKHPLEAALLRCVYLPLEVLGLRHLTILGFLAVSHLAAVGTFWVLSRWLYPVFIRDPFVAGGPRSGSCFRMGFFPEP